MKASLISNIDQLIGNISPSIGALRDEFNLSGYLFTVFFSFFMGVGYSFASPPITMVENPNVTVRLANPQFDCESEEYCLDVEFQSDQENTELFGMNVRLFYDNDYLEFINFRNYQGGYGPITPNPAINSNTTTGIVWFNFSTASADYINGAIQKVGGGEPPIYISTTGWTKLYQMCFTVDNPPDLENFCPSVVWDLEEDPAQGGFTPSAGVVMTVYTSGGGSGNALEHVEQYNWQYSGNGGAPFGEPNEVVCLNADCGNTCSLIVTSAADSGTGTLREKIACASPGDTITFGSGMAGQTILITTEKLIIDKNIYIRSNLTNRVKVISQIPGLFNIDQQIIAEFKGLDITSGTAVSNNNGAAFKNKGILRLIDVKISKNQSLPNGQYLVRNFPGSECSMLGNCFIDIP